MDLAAYRPSLAGRNQRVAEIPSVPIGEENASGVEFSAGETVVEVRQREPAFVITPNWRLNSTAPLDSLPPELQIAKAAQRNRRK